MRSWAIFCAASGGIFHEVPGRRLGRVNADSPGGCLDRPAKIGLPACPWGFGDSKLLGVCALSAVGLGVVRDPCFLHASFDMALVSTSFSPAANLAGSRSMAWVPLRLPSGSTARALGAVRACRVGRACPASPPAAINARERLVEVMSLFWGD